MKKYSGGEAEGAKESEVTPSSRGDRTNKSAVAAEPAKLRALKDGQA